MKAKLEVKIGEELAGTETVRVAETKTTGTQRYSTEEEAQFRAETLLLDLRMPDEKVIARYREKLGVSRDSARIDPFATLVDKRGNLIFKIKGKTEQALLRRSEYIWENFLSAYPEKDPEADVDEPDFLQDIEEEYIDDAERARRSINDRRQ
jgi:hypothetical protein